MDVTNWESIECVMIEFVPGILERYRFFEHYL